MKIFNLGLAKTGNISLGRALEALGYKCCYHNATIRAEVDLWKCGKAAIPLENICAEYEAVSNGLLWDCYRELFLAYPDAKFIYTCRDLSSWVTSRVVHMLHDRVTSGTWTDINTHADRKQWADVTMEIRGFFQSRQDQFLELDITQGNIWPKLCEFLGKGTPPRPDFPHSNTSLNRLDRIIDHFKDKVDKTTEDSDDPGTAD